MNAMKSIYILTFLATFLANSLQAVSYLESIQEIAEKSRKRRALFYASLQFANKAKEQEELARSEFQKRKKQKKEKEIGSIFRKAAFIGQGVFSQAKQGAAEVKKEGYQKVSDEFAEKAYLPGWSAVPEVATDIFFTGLELLHYSLRSAAKRAQMSIPQGQTSLKGFLDLLRENSIATTLDGICGVDRKKRQ